MAQRIWTRLALTGLVAAACGDDGSTTTSFTETGPMTSTTMTTPGTATMTTGPTTSETGVTDGTGGNSATESGTGGSSTTEGMSASGGTTEQATGGATEGTSEGSTGGPPPSCGDGNVDAGEECDDGNQVDTDSCTSMCKNAVCGDGIVGPLEACDDGNQVDDDACSNDCMLKTCGDGKVDAGEECDDGNADNTDACLDTCKKASCGDSFVQAGAEQCDDGNADNTDACVLGCKDATCGDGFVEAGVEDCDDQNMVNTDDCVDMCQAASCGDGFVQMGVEECDDGNENDADGCKNDCTLPPGVKSIGLGWQHTCVVTQMGKVHCWGQNTYGQLGQGNTTTIGDNEQPKLVPAVDLGAEAVEVVAGEFHTCARTTAGKVRCWGRSNVGQLGYGSVNSIGDNEKPAVAGDVDVGGTVTQLAAGRDHTCALLDTGAVRCWGAGTYGQTGHSNTVTIGDNELAAAGGDIKVDAMLKATQITAGEWFTCALLENKKIRCWGYGLNGTLGYGNQSNIGDNEFPSTAGPVNLGLDAEEVRAGRRHVCARTVNQTIRCWGLNSNGQLGYGHVNAIGDNETPNVAGDVNISGDKVLSLALGYAHSCARVEGDKVRCWGQGTNGVVGQGNTLQIGDNEQPGAIAAIDIGGPVTMIDSDNNHVCVRTANGAVRCWGQGTNGKLGYSNTLTIGDNEVPSIAGEVQYQ